MRAILIATGFISCAVMPAQATVWTFSDVLLEGAQSTPPAATPATGAVTAMLNDVTGQMIAMGSYQNLLGGAGEAHVHCCAPPGQSSGRQMVVLPTTGGGSGTFTGSNTISAADVQSVLNGLSYVNLHTAAFPDGELRGQLVNPTAPSLAGDHNMDGRVDAADYVLWRKGKGQIYGDVDYDAWRAGFGQPNGAGGSVTMAPIPEPAVGVMLIFGALRLLACRRRPQWADSLHVATDDETNLP